MVRAGSLFAFIYFSILTGKEDLGLGFVCVVMSAASKRFSCDRLIWYNSKRYQGVLNYCLQLTFNFQKSVIIVTRNPEGEEKMTGLLNPSSDFVFKNIFGVKKHERVLTCLLNAILKKHPTISSITLVNPEHRKKRKNGKSATLDIEAITDKGTLVDIEIQCSRDGNLVNRAVYYQARMIKEELDEGESYDSHPDIISIWFTDYKETNRQHHSHEAVYMFKGNSLDGIEVASEKTRIFIIELPKIDLKKAALSDMFSVWMYFLKNPELIPEEFVKKVPEVKEALEELKMLSLDEEFRASYNAHMKAQNDSRSRETSAKVEGIAIGKEEGKVEGIAIGEERGKIEKAREAAQKMLKKGVALVDISEFTGLPIKEIESLRKEWE
jgi:predicted transposase/invertase (TIGR01784 family)